MSIFSSYKKIFLLGFIIVILAVIPLSVFIAQERQQTKSKAAQATILSFDPASSTVKVGENLTLGIVLNPGTGTDANQVSFVKLSISFDASKFTTISGSLIKNPEPSNALQIEVDAPKYESGKATISLSIDANPEKAITTKTKIAILQLKATGTTNPTIPNITFDPAPDTQVLSIDSNSQTSDNVLSSAIHATATVVPATTTGTVPTATPNPTTAPSRPPPSSVLAPATPRTGGLPSSPFPSSSLSTDPTCSNLEVNGPANGSAPYPLTFTAIGNDSNGTISKISFNFGDSVEDLTVGGGIGTSSVSGQMLHTYKTPGVYYAYAILTDNNNNLSAQQDVCTKTITINPADSAQSLQPNPAIIQPLPPTGDGKIMFGLGALGAIFTIIGGVLLLL